MPMVLDKSALLSALKLKTEEVEIDGGTVIVSEIGAADYIKLWTDPSNQTDGEIDMVKFTPALLACTIVDQDGKRIFSNDDISELSRSAHAPFLKIAEAAKRLNGLSGSEIKNSESSQSDSLYIDSACNSDIGTLTT